jgi:FkbM family methyltransferase
MSVVFHYFKILKITLKGNSIGRLKILFCYSKLYVKSILHYKLKKTRLGIKTENILGFRVSFFSYPELLDLFEEIFVFEVYKLANSRRAPYIIDCGSNIGMSVLYFKLIFPQSRITAFEPHGATFNLLEANVKANNLANVSFFNFALSDVDDVGILYTKDSEGALTMSLISKGESVQEKIIIKKLSDHVHEKVDLIKIDVEGSEDKIITNLVQTGKIDLVEKMIIEFHPELTAISIEKFVGLLSKNGLTYSASKNQLHPEASEILIHCNRD